MTATAAGEVRAARDIVGVWCGCVLLAAVVLIPILGWLAPLGFAGLLALMGLLSLPAIRMTDEDRPVLIVLLAALVWAAVSTTWSPYHPKNAATSTVLKLAFMLPLGWSAVCGARRADPRLRSLALRILIWGLALFGAVLLVESLTGAELYRRLHVAFYEPIRTDLAQSNVAHATFVLAVLWPAALIGGLRTRREAWLLVPILAGTLLAAHQFKGDAPVIAVPLAAVVALAVWRWPSAAPKALAGLAAVLFIAMPGIVWAVRATGDYGAIEGDIPLSWSMRMGYWSHAIDWIRDRPLRGWGLDASRMMGPGIQLHPHNGELQVWLELGAVGAVAAAAFWWLSLSRLTRPASDREAAGVAASASVFLLFGTLNFGIWQEWWLGLGGLVAVLAAMHGPRPAARTST
ncbi:MAG: hypothetical protein JWQ46_2456 [Phenylobacterium sp.]|jgi:O-antigen ligase|nr:hypothetical protein [Phenylobacterium sp.]MDB5467694.1 hypothetical protein [Phenylobacterium sp.]